MGLYQLNIEVGFNSLVFNTIKTAIPSGNNTHRPLFECYYSITIFIKGHY